MHKLVSLENRCCARLLAVCGIFLAFGWTGLHLISSPCSAQEPEKEGAGLIISGRASAEDVGLPIYAGSKPHKGNSNDSQAARLGLWGGGTGFKLAVVNMDSSDSPGKVTAFYRKALAKYGKVLDCSNPSPAPSNDEEEGSSITLTCGDDRPEKGVILLKSGTKEKQHIVSIQPSAGGSFYQLVAVGNWSTNNKN